MHNKTKLRGHKKRSIFEVHSGIFLCQLLHQTLERVEKGGTATPGEYGRKI